MPRISVIARTYAKTLFLASKNSNSIDKVSDDLELFRKNFSNEFANELKDVFPECLPFIAISLCDIEIVNCLFVIGHCDAFVQELYAQENSPAKVKNVICRHKLTSSSETCNGKLQCADTN